ncbi:MAG: hypothetical protein FWC79_03150 [Oscillospiraceae bacterium]|nr:hypothetical protein [Oscillospiraceae bacterium]
MFDTLGGLAELESAMTEFVEIVKETSEVSEIKTEILNNEKLTCEI